MSSQTEQKGADIPAPSENTPKEEVKESPAEPTPHHISDVDVWGGPDRSYFTFVIISILFGFFGLDHFYLRSFGTGTQKLFVNILSLGFWYWWDVIQIASDGQKIRTDGLSSPLDWVRGIGRGVFSAPVANKKVGGKDAKDADLGYGAKKSYLLYSFLAIFFGWLGADKFYMGELWQGLAKLISCFNIFLFLFGWLWVLWDSFYAFFLTDSILANGISVPLPYTMMFSSTIPGSVFKVKKLTEEDLKSSQFTSPSFGFAEFCSRWFSIPIPTFPAKEIYREVVAPLLTVPVVSALKSVGPNAPPQQPSCMQEVANMIPTSQQVHQSVMDSAIAGRETVATVAEPIAIMSKGVGNAIHKVETNPALSQPQPVMAPPPNPMQTGGGRNESSGPGPVIAGALTAVVLAGGLKGFYDLISKQYG